MAEQTGPANWVEKKLVFENDTAARYIFFALKNDLGGMEGFQLGFKEFVIHMDTYSDTKDFDLTRSGKVRRKREKWSGSEPVSAHEEKRRKFLENTCAYQKKTVEKGRDDEELKTVAVIQTYRMMIAVITDQKKPVGMMHCDRSMVLDEKGSEQKQFYEIELHYPDNQESSEAMQRFSRLLQNTFHLTPISFSKLERALDKNFENAKEE